MKLALSLLYGAASVLLTATLAPELLTTTSRVTVAPGAMVPKSSIVGDVVTIGDVLGGVPHEQPAPTSAVLINESDNAMRDMGPPAG
ncbi:MAG: hypothetical protein QM817_33220 [Archangium sp.]